MGESGGLVGPGDQVGLRTAVLRSERGQERRDVLGAVVMWAAIATGVFFFVAPLRRWFGLVERALYWATFGWLALAAADLIAIYG